MIERKMTEDKMVAMQLTTDEGAFIGNIVESDVVKMAAKAPGIFVVIHCAIRLDAMFDGRYEIYKTKTIEASSIDFYQSFHKPRAIGQKERPNLKGRKAKDE
jgi:hypothetical protein